MHSNRLIKHAAILTDGNRERKKEVRRRIRTAVITGCFTARGGRGTRVSWWIKRTKTERERPGMLLVGLGWGQGAQQDGIPPHYPRTFVRAMREGLSLPVEAQTGLATHAPLSLQDQVRDTKDDDSGCSASSCSSPGGGREGDNSDHSACSTEEENAGGTSRL